MKVPLHSSILWFFKNHLGIVTCLGLMLASYLGFYWLTAHRLSEKGLRTRMYVYARLIEESGKKWEKPENPTLNHYQSIVRKVVEEETLAHAENNFVSMSFQIDSKTDPSGPKSEDNAISKVAEQLLEMAQNPPPSYAYLNAVKSLQNNLQTIHESHPKESREILNDQSWQKIKTRFRVDDYQRKGLDFRTPTGDLTTLRDEAALFLTHRDIFRGKFSNAPLPVQIRPWVLLRAYDNRRVHLSDTIPIALGILGLAVGTFLQILLHDVKKKRSGFMFRKQAEDWINLWEVKDGSNPLVLRIFSKKQFWAVTGLLMAITLFIELLINTPQTRLEWVPNVPIMITVAILLSVLWVCLYDISGTRLNPKLIHRTPAFRTRLLRPLYSGITALLLVTTWGTIYSLFELAPLSDIQQLRAGVQIGICGITMILLLKILHNLDRNLRIITLQAARLQPSIDIAAARIKEKELNRLPRSEVFSNFMPTTDIKLVKVAMIVLLPLPSFLKLLIQ